MGDASKRSGGGDERVTRAREGSASGSVGLWISPRGKQRDLGSETRSLGLQNGPAIWHGEHGAWASGPGKQPGSQRGNWLPN